MEGKQLLKVFTNPLNRNLSKKGGSSKPDQDSSEPSTSLPSHEHSEHQTSSPSSFEEAIAQMESIDNKPEMPENLQGGILVDRIFAVSPYDLNTCLFAPNSKIRKDFAALQGTTNLQEGPWALKPRDMSCLTRIVSYTTKAASKFIKVVNATEEQTYIRVTKEEFGVLLNVSMPELPFGNRFRIKLLYKIMPVGGLLSSGEVSSHLVVSWGADFLQKTMMKGMIERGIRQGLKEGFDQFSNLLALNFKVLQDTFSRS
ncbi:hypothetical protein RIF29_10356 [Crotalaria pallida]|uniref:VASt domain-containing protein n=1 Tax=Crotalaria pallida TaxID=3830 RepID=A0AAN9IIC4_CROPI